MCKTKSPRHLFPPCTLHSVTSCSRPSVNAGGTQIHPERLNEGSLSGNTPQLPEGDGSLLSAAPGGNIQTARR